MIMADAGDLEAKLGRNPSAGSPDDLDQLVRHYWQMASGEKDYRKRQKLLKRSSHYAGHAFNAGMEDPDALRLYMDIARETALVHSSPQDERKKLALITARWLTVTGAGEHTVLAQRKGKVALETATFGLGNVGLAPDAVDQPWSDGQMVKLMTKSQRLFFGTGFDGLLKAEIWVIDGTAPVLLAKEYKKLSSSTPSVVLQAPTGRIALADYALMTEPWSADPIWDSVVIEAPPGNYKACAFGFSTARSNSVIAVLCLTDEMAPNTVSGVDSLFM